MPLQRIYYEYGQEGIIPYWYVLTFKSCELNWDKPIYYIKFDTNIEYEECSQFEDSLYSMSILISDIIFSNTYPGKIGININAIKKRILKHNVDPSVITQLIAPISVISEISCLLPNKRNKEVL